MLFEQILLGKPIQPGKKNLFPTDNEYPTSAHGILPRQLASCEHKKQKQPKKSEDQQQKNTDDQKQSQQEKQTIRMTEHSLWFDNEENVTEDDYCQNSQQQELFETFIQTQVLDYNQSTKAKYVRILFKI
ncbi:unnamed protein product [Didymodactylos carnosus]|uniref:Uncharacterized protein n=1 Tax=Didymodactylos carnosus TaxID=1234261 RepID=A0A813VKQ8_9BILA|nr:unnamed protein product [Didymodactylos carnosus]CAF1013195.1 unnamed protein product [Didymodactylos carnosus]CAF3625314.1 unnamed protein product [Didymodactylos carnosus]CAF3782127.1 unnamed protein product [Didymodactylos carnosus]